MSYRLASGCVAALVVLGCSGSDDETPSSALALTWVTAPPAEATSQSDLTLEARLTKGGKPVANEPFEISVDLGGGSVDATSATSDASGVVQIAWTLGIPPIENKLTLAAPGRDLQLGASVSAKVDTPYSPEPFGDVNAYLEAQQNTVSTEDLAFMGGRLLLGVGADILSLDENANIEAWTLSGTPISRALGIAADGQGNLYVADSDGGALLKVASDKTVSLVTDTNGSEPLQLVNYVALAPNGDVLFSDSCLGDLVRYDPKTSSVVATLQLDPSKESGPNGIAVDREGHYAYVLTENTRLFCNFTNVEVTDNAALYRVDISGGGLDTPEQVVGGLGLAGDGLAFDAEDNLYVIVDKQKGGSLEESAVQVLPAGGQELRPFISVSNRVIANIAFGQGAFGETTLYAALLAVVPFTPADQRGVQRLEVGVPGLPLLPASP